MFSNKYIFLKILWMIHHVRMENMLKRIIISNCSILASLYLQLMYSKRTFSVSHGQFWIFADSCWQLWTNVDRCWQLWTVSRTDVDSYEQFHRELWTVSRTVVNRCGQLWTVWRKVVDSFTDSCGQIGQMWTVVNNCGQMDEY